MTGKRGISTGIVLGIMLIVAIVFGAGVYLYANNKTAKEKEKLNAQITELQNKISGAKTATMPTDEIANWKTYTNTKYGYSFKYPDTVTMTASEDNSDNLAINPTADGVNVFPVGGNIGNGIFYISSLNIEFTTDAIKGQFGATKPEDITLTPTTIAGASSYKVTILGDSAVVSAFYYIKSPSGTVLELTVVNGNSDAQKILSSFQFIKSDSAQQITAQDSSDLILSGIKLAIPSNWKIKDKSDKSIVAEIPGIKSPVTLSMEKCDESGPVGCFGTARFNFRKTSWGGIYDLASNANDLRYGLEFDNLENNEIKSMNLYTSDTDFGDYQPSDKDIAIIDNIMKSASLAGK